MSNTENIEVEAVESTLPPLPIPSIFYRGPENYVSVIGSHSRTNYQFSVETGYTVEPVCWEDFYEMILLDRVNIRNRLYVVAKDPLAETNLRRVAPIDDFVPPEIVENQEEIDREVAKRQNTERLKNEYIQRVNFKIATGELDHIPETLEADADEYAKTQIDLEAKALEPTVEATVENPVVLTEETKVEDPVVPTIPEDPVVLTDETKVEETPIVPETPVEDTVNPVDPEVPVDPEAPTEPTTEVLEKSENVSDTVPEPPVENPVVPEEPTEPETPVDDSKSTPRKKSSR